MSLTGFSQYRTETLFSGESGSKLLTLLFNNYKTNNVLSYTDARVLMYKSIYNVHDSVRCVYSHHALYLDPNYPNPIDYLAKSGSNNGINCEHSFPQSKGAETGIARSDMHHLFPVRAAVNEARSNYPYAEIEDSKTKSWFFLSNELNTIPKSNVNEYSESISGAFEPREDHKGNAARAIFYFYTMYEIQSDQAFFEQMKPTLCNWHVLDPVDSLEWIRTYEIAKYQDNKPNPFVLDCTLPYRCYCQNLNPCNVNSTEDLRIQLEHLYTPNPFQDEISLHLSNTSMNISAFKISNIQGTVFYNFVNPKNSSFEDIGISTALWPSGLYILTFNSPASGSFAFKILKK